MVFQGEKKTIKIRLKPELRQQVSNIEKGENTLLIRATYQCEYNEKLLEANHLHGGSRTSKQYQQNRIPTKLCFESEVQRLKSSLRRGHSLGSSRKQNSFEKFRDSSVKKAKNSKLNEDLDFLFRNEEYGRLVRQQQAQTVKTIAPQKSRFIQTDPTAIRQVKHQNLQKQYLKTANYRQEKVGSLPFSQQLIYASPPVKRIKLNRTFYLVILAVIAAFCLALGQGIGSVFKG